MMDERETARRYEEELRAIAANIEVGRREPNTHYRLQAIADFLGQIAHGSGDHA